MFETYNHFARLAETLPIVLGQVVRKTAFDLQAMAVSFAPVDTGFLRNSIYVETWDSSDYGSGGFGGLNQELLPEVAAPQDELTAYVAVGASYGIYVELGTRFMPPDPFFYPAVDLVQPAFDDALGAIEDKWGIEL